MENLSSILQTLHQQKGPLLTATGVFLGAGLFFAAPFDPDWFLGLLPLAAALALDSFNRAGALFLAACATAFILAGLQVENTTPLNVQDAATKSHWLTGTLAEVIDHDEGPERVTLRLENVRLYRAAVSDRVARQELIVGEPGATFNHLRYEDEVAHSGEKTISIESVVLDELVARGEIRPPVLVKVDVEGHGARALAGARQTLAAHHPVLVMSFHSHAEANDTRALLEPLGYRPFENDGRPLDWGQIVFRTASLEVRSSPA